MLVFPRWRIHQITPYSNIGAIAPRSARGISELS